MIFLMLINANVTRADCNSQLKSCDEALTAAGEVIEAKKKVISLCNLGLSQTLEKNKILKIEVDEKSRELDAWYRNPFIVGALGIAAGIVIIEVAK